MNQFMENYEEKYGLYRKHMVLLSILSKFDKLCRENDVQYSLEAGTLLGSVRHKGFIPWDDDADVVITRSEYNKLLHLPSDMIDDIMIVKTSFLDRITISDNNPEELYVDLFIVDNLPDSLIKRKILFLHSKILRCWFFNKKQFSKARLNSKGVKKVCKLILVFCGILIKPILHLIYPTHRSIVKHYEKKLCKYSETREVSPMTDSIEMMVNKKYNSKWFSQYSDISFCNQTFRAIANYDEYLTYNYGNYMELPSEEKRIPEGHGNLKQEKYYIV